MDQLKKTFTARSSDEIDYYSFLDPKKQHQSHHSSPAARELTMILVIHADDTGG